MTSTGLVDRIAPSRYLLIIVATVMAATKCKLGENCCRRLQQSSATPPRRAERVMQRIHKMFQGNCVTPRRPDAERLRREASSVERIRRRGNRRVPASRRKADLLSCTTALPASVI